MKYIGKKIENVKYRKRPGAYAIITRSEDKKIAIGATEDYFLLGGGIENGETAQEALRREIIEETGYSIKNVVLFDEVVAYADGKEKGPLYIEATIYIAEFDKYEKEKIEKDHRLLWVDAKDYVSKLYHEYQRYILNEYIEKYEKGNK